MAKNTPKHEMTLAGGEQGMSTNQAEASPEAELVEGFTRLVETSAEQAEAFTETDIVQGSRTVTEINNYEVTDAEGFTTIIPGSRKTVDGNTYTILRRVTYPTLEFKTDGQTVVCRIMEAIVHKAMTIKDETTGIKRAKLDDKGQPAYLWIAKIEAPNGEIAQLVLGELVAGELQENYPDDGYVDCWFTIHRVGKKPGKRYVSYDIDQIRDPRRKTSRHDADGVIVDDARQYGFDISA